MQLLKKLSSVILLLATACTSGGPISPEESARQMREAFAAHDAKAFKALLSQKSLDKVNLMVTSLKSVEGKQRDNVARYYGLNPETLASLNSETFLAYYIKNESKQVLGNILTSQIVGVDRSKTRATIHFEAGAALDFVREGPYWKFDLTKL